MKFIKITVSFLLIVLLVYYFFFIKTPFGDETIKANLDSISDGAMMCCVEKVANGDNSQTHLLVTKDSAPLYVDKYLYSTKQGYFDPRYCTRQISLCKETNKLQRDK
jgi:hypothetical protein